MKFRWHYLLYMTGFIVILVALGEMNYYFDTMQQATYKSFPWSILATLSYLSIGVYLGLPLLIKEVKKTGKWRVNLQKLTLIGLPSFYLGFSCYIPVLIPPFLFRSYEELSLGGIIATGYVVVVSFTKENK